MPNLNQILKLKSHYYSLNDQEKDVTKFFESTVAKESIRKAFRPDMLNEAREEFFSFNLNESFNVDKPDIIQYFENAQEQDVILLFIDITSFSKTIKGWANTSVRNFLDEYYKKIIPIIYEHGGEIEKLIGDGIIVVFGKPFLNVESPHNVYKAKKCAEAVIKEFHGTDKNVKVAIHKGEVNYYRVPGDHYGEYTMIGQAITDLYRLESVSVGNCINFFDTSTYDALGWKYSEFDLYRIYFREKNTPSLQGIDYNSIKCISFPGYN